MFLSGQKLTVTVLDTSYFNVFVLMKTDLVAKLYMRSTHGYKLSYHMIITSFCNNEVTSVIFTLMQDTGEVRYDYSLSAIIRI